MKSLDEDDRDELAQRVVAGELSLQDPRIAERRRQDDAFARRLDQLLELRALLDRDARDERQVLQAIQRPRSRRRLWLLGVVAAAAAAVVGAVALNWSDDLDERLADQGQVLGADEIALENLRPAGAGQDLGTFSFEASLPPGASSEIRVWDAAAPEGAAPLFVGSFSGTRWSPAAAELALLPDAIRWELRVSDVDGDRLGFARVELATR